MLVGDVGAVGGERVKVLDFGLAKLLGGELEGYVSSGETVIGTPQFMAPERLVGRPADARADVYSVGVTLYLMLTGALPFGQSDENMLARAILQLRAQPTFIQRLRPELPDALALFIMRTVARSRRARPSLSEIDHELCSWAQRWSEPWPPQVSQSTRSPLEVGQTRKLTPERPVEARGDEWSTMPTPPVGLRPSRPSRPKRGS